MLSYEILPSLQKVLNKLSKKDKIKFLDFDNHDKIYKR